VKLGHDTDAGEINNSIQINTEENLRKIRSQWLSGYCCCSFVRQETGHGFKPGKCYSFSKAKIQILSWFVYKFLSKK